MEEKEVISIPVEFLTELLNIRKEYFKVCDEFKIPVKKRGEEWVGKAIIERIHTYLTSYILRRSNAEKENGAAFIEQIGEIISDPFLNEKTES